MDGILDVETELLDLSKLSFGQIRQAREAIERPTGVVLKQVERPRINQGSSGPPGRAD